MCFLVYRAAILWSSILLDFVCFYELGGTATFPKLEGMVLCVIIPCVDCVCLVTLAGWTWVWSGALGHSVLWLPWWNGQWGSGHVPGWSRGFPFQRVHWKHSWSGCKLGGPRSLPTEGTLVGQLKLKWIGAGPWVLHTQGALAGLLKLKWVQAGMSGVTQFRGCPGRVTRAKACVDQGDLEHPVKGMPC